MNSHRAGPAASPTEAPSDDAAAARIKESLESLVRQLCDPLREELDAVRAALDTRLAAVAASFASRDHSESLDTLVLDLSRAAAEQAEAAASRARLDAQEAARAEQGAAQAAAQKQLDAESAANMALRQSLDDTRRQLDTIQAEVAVLQASRIEMELRLDQAEAARSELAGALAKAEREVTEARGDVEACTVRLDTAHARVEALEQERAELLQARDEVEAARRYAAAMKEQRDRLKVEMQALIDEGDREATALAASLSDSNRHMGGHVDRAPSVSAPAVTPDVSQSHSSSTRAAQRVAMPEGSEIVVDSTVCLLVNLSSQGAQIRSLRAMRPNHVARISLPRGEEALPCKGRIVWAVFEMPSAGGEAMYRAGVQFTEVDQQALDAFLLQRGAAERVPRSKKAEPAPWPRTSH